MQSASAQSVGRSVPLREALGMSNMLICNSSSDAVQIAHVSSIVSVIIN